MKFPSILKLFMDEPNNEIKESENKKATKRVKQSNKSKKNIKTKPKNVRGLTTEQAQALLKKEGENKLISSKTVSAISIFAGQFKDFLVLILLVSTLISVFMGEIVEAISISFIVLLNALMGFFQEYHTEKTLETLNNMVSQTAKVIRDGKICKIPANLIVCGDEIIVEAGDKIPADAVVIESIKMEIDESILTGESVSIAKNVDPLLDDKNDLNKSNIMYMGTSVVKGHGRGRIVATGMNTQMGKIAGMIDDIEDNTTPLQKRLDQMGKFIVTCCFIISVIVIITGILRGEDLLEMVITGLSLAVASIPEGLPAIVTIALALAVKRMVKRKALVRKLHAVETLGCANVVCTDKTGTLTQNKMTVKRFVTAYHDFKVEGDGLNCTGGIVLDGQKIKVSRFPALERMIETSVMCNSAQISLNSKQSTKDRKRKVRRAIGEPTEIALLISAAKGEVTKDSLRAKYSSYDEIPFDSSSKCMTVFAKDQVGKKYAFVKGAYDVIAKKCSLCEDDNDITSFKNVQYIFDRKNEELAKSGMRVLAFAYKEVSADKSDGNLIFLGICAMYDPPRKEAKSAVMTCRCAGIRTVMITGDHRFTAISIAKQVGIYRNGDSCVDGSELDSMSDAKLNEIINNTTVFARVSPGHKLRIVKAFKNQGNVVAMTGDGVNDAPAIKESDIGVSMGESGSDVTKQAADVILLDDNFATLVVAVEEGRVIYGNIRKFIRYLISCNIGEVVTMFMGMLIGMPIPLLPMQILMINLVTDSLPAVSLGLEPAEEGTMRKPPRNVKDSIFSGGLMFTIIIRGILIGFTTLSVFTVIFRMTLSVDIARTAAFLTLVSTQLIHVFECKSETKSIFNINYFNNKVMLFAILTSVIVAIISVWVDPINKLLRNCPLTLEQTFVVVIFTLVIPVLNAITLWIKQLIGKKDKNQNIKVNKLVKSYK